MENETRDPWGAETLSGQPSPQPSPQPSQWGTSDQPQAGDPFHRGFVRVLRVVTYLLSFGVPLLLFVISLGGEGGEYPEIAFCLCAALAAVLWLTWSYATKLFDLVSKLARSNDELVRLQKGDKDD